MKLNPWIHHTLLGFGVFNIVIGITLLFWYPPIPLVVVSPLIPQMLWACVFLASGLALIYGLLKNYTTLLRYLMIFGLFLKTMWEIGLLIRIHEGASVFSVELWGMIAYMQFLGVVFFDPRKHHAHS